MDQNQLDELLSTFVTDLGATIAAGNVRFLCVPHARSEGAVDPLGNQAGEDPIRAVIDAAGFTDFARVTETPFNIVYAARP